MKLTSTQWLKRFSGIVLTILFLISFNVHGPLAQGVPAVSAAETDPETMAKIEPGLLKELNRASQADFFIILTETADLSPAYQLDSKEARGQFVFKALRETAERSQADLRTLLTNRSIEYRPYYISNKILVRNGNRALLLDLAARDDVAHLTENHTFQLPPPIINAKAAAAVPDTVETNISFVNGDDVWSLGILGEGTVVAGTDTGLDWDHPALINQYRGWDGATANHNYNWWDATRTYPNSPNDGHGHGTHTSGTMVGNDGGSNQIGMAPGAQLIHCKNLDDFGSGTDAMVSECFEWSLAPWDLTGQNPRPDLAPDAINNSWGFGGGGVTFMQDEIAALQAAGIVIEVSAGNAGPGCGTLGSPGDYGEVLTTGSINHASGVLPGTLTVFSSRGPSSLSGEYIPDVMAPGENIRSSVPGGGYEGGWSGTSMSGPHVTGLVALMWSANPALRGFVQETAQLINDTAVPLAGQTGSNCGGDYTDGPNNDWGHGTIDALAAVQAAMVFGDPGTLTGTITDANTSAPLANVTVKATLPSALSWKRFTNDNGIYSMLVFSGTYAVEANLYGYFPQTFNDIQVTSFNTTTLDIALAPAPFYTVSGTVTDAVTGWPLYAAIRVIGFPGETIWTDPETGTYAIDLAAGVDYTFQVTPWSAGYNTNNRVVPSLTGDQVEDFALQPNLLACAAPGYEPQFVYFEDFETDDGGYTVAGGLTSWGWGEPKSGPGAAFSGSNAWATNLFGNYDNNEAGYVTTPLIDLSAYAGQTVVVSWWQWLKTESFFDYATVEISNDGGASWNTYYWADGDASLSWTKQSVILDSSYAVSGFQMRFGLFSDFSITFPGFYVDDVGIGVATDTPFLYYEDLELNDGSFAPAGTNSSWAWGTPTRGPGSAFSGINAWATSLAGNYNNDESSQITSPPIDLTAAAGEELLLTWYQWLQTESVYDLAAVEVSNNGGADWVTMFGPLSGPIDTGWNRYSVLLDSSFAVSNFRVRFTLQSDDSVNYPGFYVDDIGIRVYSDSLPFVPCNALPGGLVLGNVYDLNTSLGLPGSRVTHAQGHFATAAATPQDPAVDDGFYLLFSPAGSQTITATMPSYGAAAALVSVPTSDVVRQDFSLDAALLAADPDNLAVDLMMGETSTMTFSLDNLGGLATPFTLRERNHGFLPTRVVSTQPVRPVTGGSSVTRPVGFAPMLAAQLSGPGDEPACIFKDLDPWGVTDVEQFLLANAIPFQVYGSADMAALDFSDCQMIIISGDQPSSFYNTYGGHVAKFEDYVAGGGFLNFFATDNGWNGGILTAPLPGGLTWQFWLDEINLIDELGHPVVAGVPNPFIGFFASHGYFGNLPAEALVIAHGSQSGLPTIVEYGIGSGLVVAFGQPLEISHSFGWDAGLIMENALLYGRNYAPPDVPWLDTQPISGTISAAGSLTIVASFDAGVPEIAQPGDYLAELRVEDDSPYKMAGIPVVMTVGAPASWGKVSGVVTGLANCDLPGNPLANAIIAIDGLVNVKSGSDGSYGYWMEEGDYSATVSASGFISKHVNFVINAGQTTGIDVELRRDEPCIGSGINGINVSMRQGTVQSVPFEISNSGAAALTYEFRESSFMLPPTFPKRAPAAEIERFGAPAATGPLSVRAHSALAGAALPIPESNWFAGADQPDGIVRYGHAQCDEYPGSFYVISGVDGGYNISNKAWRYDAGSNRWTELAPIPQGQEGTTAVCYQGRIYVLGGSGSDQFYVYDIGDNSWSAAAPLPRGVWGAAAGAWDGKIYLVGGDNDFWPAGTSDRVDIYEIASNSWVGTGTPMPAAAVTPGYVQAANLLYVAGGWDDNAPGANVAVTQRYDMSSDSWEVGPSLVYPRADFALAMTSSALYAIGGDSDGSGFFDASKRVEQLLLTNWQSGAWSDLSDPLPAATTANQAGFCTSGFFPAQVWSVGGLSNWSIQGFNRFLGRPAESCFSIYGDLNWLSVSPAAGTIQAGGLEVVTLTIDSRVLVDGIYQATLVIISDDPGRPLINLPVTVIVTENIPLYLPVVFND